jgi:hypothetical protein
MTAYLNTLTNEYPRHDGDLELLGWVPGEPLLSYWVEVEYVKPPTLLPGQTYEQIPPAQDPDGIWRMKWAVRDLTADEKLEIVRIAVRDKVGRGETITAAEAKLLVG